MKIVFLNISLRPHRPHRNYPIGLAYVASAMRRAGIPFEIVDLEATRPDPADIESILRETGFDLLAIGTLVTGYRAAKEIAALARRINPAAMIVAGNSLASSIPEILLTRTEFDVAVIGEGDETMVELARAAIAGRPLSEVPGLAMRGHYGGIIYTVPRDAMPSIDAIPAPAWDLFDMETYIAGSIYDVPDPCPIPRKEIRSFPINTARGCPFRCTFCYHVFRDAPYRRKSADVLLDEIAELQARYRLNWFSFYDELTFHSQRQVREFVDRIAERKMSFFWVADIRGNLFDELDIPLLERTRAAGCQGFGYSLESADEEILAAMAKRITPQAFASQARALASAGIPTFTSLVIGYPQETPATLAKTFNLCYDLDLYPSAGYLLPQPGTPMYDLARQRGLIPDEEEYLLRLGDRQDLRINLTAMPDEQLVSLVEGHLRRIAEKLGLPFAGETLLRTGALVINSGVKNSS